MRKIKIHSAGVEGINFSAVINIDKINFFISCRAKDRATLFNAEGFDSEPHKVHNKKLAEVVGWSGFFSLLKKANNLYNQELNNAK